MSQTIMTCTGKDVTACNIAGLAIYQSGIPTANRIGWKLWMCVSGCFECNAFTVDLRFTVVKGS